MNTPTAEPTNLGVDATKTQTLTEHERNVLQAYLTAIRSVAQLIYLKKEVPSGHLYAELCGVLNLDQYAGIVGHLKRLGFVKESGFVLKWVGPEIQLDDTKTSQPAGEVM